MNSGYGQFAGAQLGSSRQPQPAYAYGGAGHYVGKVPSMRGNRTRLNVAPVVFSLMLPWLLFTLVVAMLSFGIHYKAPSVCYTICIVLGVILGGTAVLSFLKLLRSYWFDEVETSTSTWVCFFATTSIVALVLGVCIGDRNFFTNMQPYYDLVNLNSYNFVDPSRMRGQELMDAGKVKFVEDTHVDLSKAMAFRNQETYCVAPISGGAVNGDPPLNSYDFWAVGKDCCPGSSKVDFQCGAINSEARGGLRMLRNEERGFYRLAVQQAQSAYNIKAIHPLFFHWVQDPEVEEAHIRMEGYRYVLVAMFAHFGFQIGLVYLASVVFAKFLYA